MSELSRPSAPKPSGALRLDLDLRYVPGVGAQRQELLAKLGLRSVYDVLRYFPRRYEDRRSVAPLGALSGEETTVVRGLVKRVRERRSRGGRSVLTARIEDGSGSLELVWFEQPYIAEWLRAGFFVTAYGDVRRRGGVLQIVAPEFEVEADDGDDADGPSLHLRRIVPIYALTRGIQQRFLRRLVDRVLSAAAELGDGPADLLRPGSPALADAYRDVHFPSTFDALEAARARLGFDDHFRFASALLFRRRRFRETGGASYAVSRELDQKIRSLFPFQLTKDQDGAIAEIVRDLGGPEPMYRLLQGDVGTGKTAVALYALLVAVRHGEQGCLMAPTEVLAEQHHRTLRRFLAKHPVRIELLSGSTRPSERDRILADLEAGKAHLIVGTHALLQDPVRFRKLGVAVIDEQHRFGVRDRKRLREKGDRPHVLIMTATPIPRSLCMTCYGDLDVSLLRNRPPGRQPVETRIVTAGKEKAALELVRSEVRRGRQAFFIYPLIDESEELAVPAATAGYERLSREVFPEFRVGLVHGRMSSAAKDEALEEFRANRIQILVATVVIEVGIDVPNATVLYIEDASRFGIAQLHQLRGRVGRGEHRGYCLVGQGSGGRETRERLRVFASTDDGFRLAEEDLRLRGPGDYLGVRQSGRPSIASPLEDLEGFLEVKRQTEEFWRSPRNEPYRERWRRFLIGAGEDARDEEFWGLD